MRMCDNVIVSEFGKVFKNLRKQSGYTQESFCEAFNANESITTINSIKNWEQGKSIPEWKTIMKLCDFFGCDMDYLFGRIVQKTHSTQFICNATGLSEKAVLMLIALEDKDIIAFINGLLLHGEEHDGETIMNLGVMSAIIKEKRALLLQLNKKDPEYLHCDIDLAGLMWKCQDYLVKYIEDSCNL